MVNYKKLVVYLISFFIIYTPTLTFASAAEKWELVANTYDRAKNVVDVTARKVGQTAANSSVYKVQVPVNAATLGSSVKSMLGMGLAVAAITALVEGVGWIIENGVVKKLAPNSNADSNPQYYWISQASSVEYAPSLSVACPKHSNFGGGKGSDLVSIDYERPDFVYCNYRSTEYPDLPNMNSRLFAARINNPNHNPDITPTYVPVSDTELGNEVLGKGTEPNSNPNPTPDIISDAYNPNHPTEGGQEADTALDVAPPQPETPPKGDTKPKPNVDTDGDGVPDTYDPEKPNVGEEFELPAFCSWAVTVCTWYTQYKEDSKKTDKHREEQEKPFFEKVKDWFDWTQKDRENTDDQIDISTPTQPDIDTNINFNSSCPAPITLASFSYHGSSQNWQVDFSQLCDSFSTFVKPVVIAMGAFSAVLIVSGVRTNE